MRSSIILLIPLLFAAAMPLEDPLGTWLYHSETFGPLLPGELPSFHAISFDPEGNSSWIWELLHERDSFRNWKLTAAGEGVSIGGDIQSRLGGMVAFELEPAEWLSIRERTSIWTGSDELPPTGFSPYHYGLEEGRHLYVDWGYLAASAGPVDVSVGRIPLRWGPGRYSQLLISGKAPAMDMFKLDAELAGWIDFSGFTATIKSDTSTWLSAHRLDITPLENLRLGLSESILYTADGIDLAYANLIIPWYPVQWNERIDDNAFMCIDGTWRPLQGLVVYGEFLMDDIQYNNPRGVPNKLGYTAGVDLFHGNTGLGAILEYTAVQRYVYSQRRVVNYYLHDDRIIGCQLGPDADRFTGGVSWCGIPDITAELTAEFTRHGEGNVYEGWPDTFPEQEPFPSGIVEETWKLSMEVGWYPLDNTGIFAEGWYSSTTNSENQEGVEVSEEGFRLEAVRDFTW